MNLESCSILHDICQEKRISFFCPKKFLTCTLLNSFSESSECLKSVFINTTNIYSNKFLERYFVRILPSCHKYLWHKYFLQVKNGSCFRLHLLYPFEFRNSRVTKSSYETELRKMTSHFELLTRSRKIKSFTSSY